MAMKRAQVTIFIIIGIVLLIVFAVILVLTKIIQTEQLATAQTKQEQALLEGGQIIELVQHCLQTTTIENTKQIMAQGGYSEIPPELILHNTSIWSINQINVQPTLTDIQLTLQQSIEKELPNCLNYSYFVQQGFVITSGKFHSEIKFGRNNVISALNYSLQVSKGSYSKNYDRFETVVNLPVRRLFETASTIINLQLRPDFRRSYPFSQLNNSEVNAQFFNTGPNLTQYKLSASDLQLFFVSQFGPSFLRKEIDLQQNSHIVPTTLPLRLTSIDHRANLWVMPGTTVNFNNAPVSAISVQQAYDQSVVRVDIPLEEDEENNAIRGDITWNLSNPIYQFEPTGLRFNQPARLVLYWNEEETSRLGNMGILYTEGDGWRPLPSKANYSENYVYTDIPGFSEFTAVDCGRQDFKAAATTARIDPGGGCIAKLIITIVVIIIIVALIVLTMGGATPLAAGASTTLSSTGTVVAGSSGAVVNAAGAGGVTALAAGETATIASGTLVTSLGTGTLVSSGGAFLTTAGAATTGFFGTLGAATAGIFAGAFTALGAVTVITAGIIGGAFLNAQMGFAAGDDTITFTPTCDQNITVTLSEHGGTGICSPEGNQEITAGNPVSLQSQMQKCNMVRAMFCISCKATCRTVYK